MVLGQKSAPSRVDEDVDNEDSDRGNYQPDWAASKASTNADFNSPDITPKSTSSEDEDDALSYFQRTCRKLIIEIV